MFGISFPWESGVSALLTKKQDQKRQSREEFVSDVVTGKVTDPTAIVKGMEAHGIGLQELSSRAQWSVKKMELQQRFAKRANAEAEMRDCETERAAVNATLQAELTAAHKKARTAYIALDQRVAEAQRLIIDADNARNELLAKAPEAGEIARLAAAGAQAVQEAYHGSHIDWQRDQRRYRGMLERAQRDLNEILAEREVIGRAGYKQDEAQKLQTEVKRYTEQLQVIDAHIAQWEQQAKRANDQVLKIEAEILNPTVSA